MDDDESVVLTFEDTTLVKADLKLLDDGYWLNDKIIGFFYDLNDRIVFCHLDKDVVKKSQYIFLNPATMLLMKFIDSPDELREALEALNLEKREIVFLPINNSHDPESPGGSHWSLLVYHRHFNAFYYFDSAHEMNKLEAAETAKKLYPLVHPEHLYGKHDPQHIHKSGHHKNSNAVFNIAKTPQQNNGYDCGVYVLAITEVLATNSWMEYDKLLKKKVTPQAITKMRERIRSIILDKAKQLEEKEKKQD